MYTVNAPMHTFRESPAINPNKQKIFWDFCSLSRWRRIPIFTFVCDVLMRDSALSCSKRASMNSAHINFGFGVSRYSRWTTPRQHPTEELLCLDLAHTDSTNGATEELVDRQKRDAQTGSERLFNCQVHWRTPNTHSMSFSFICVAHTLSQSPHMETA